MRPLFTRAEYKKNTEIVSVYQCIYPLFQSQIQPITVKKIKMTLTFCWVVTMDMPARGGENRSKLT